MPRAHAERTLVKSPPELWELVDDRELMERWTAELLDYGESVAVEVIEREPGERLAWCHAGPDDASLELSLAEKGWGTHVSIRAECDSDDESAVLERLLDELGSPQRRPFQRG